VEMNDGKRVRESYVIKGARKVIAERMLMSQNEFPQGRGSAQFETDRLWALKDELKAKNANVSMTSLITKLLAMALKEHPDMNSSLTKDGVMTIYDSVNIGVGIGLPQGIMTVVIKEAQDKNIFEISDELQDYIEKLKTKKLSYEHMIGETYTLSNMGMLAVEQLAPFINPPCTGILGVGITKRGVVVDPDDTIRIATLTNFTSVINHAAVDGLHGGKFFGTLKKMVENPDDYLGL